MTCQCCTPTVDQEPQRKAESIATDHADCGCGPDCGCGCGTLGRADTERHLEEIRRRVSALAPAGA